jgi:deazaflavin-dependent oxidoreductase (nitroreductase family)
VQSSTPAADHFARKQPGWFTKNVFNRLVALFARAGLRLRGLEVLEVRGRKSGQPRRTPVNLLDYEGERYLVAPRGDTQWARNLRVSGEGRLLSRGRAKRFTAVEVSDEQKPPILRAYLEHWAWETGVFFDGVSASSSESELREASSKHPVFRLAQSSPASPAAAES